MINFEPLEEICAIGIMSGTSLDGLDLCFCRFRFADSRWHFSIEATDTADYPADVKEKLGTAQCMDALSFALFHKDYGKHIGETCRHFIRQNRLSPDIIAAHGHSIFHQPAKQFTFQIGCGANIAAETGIATICDFRTTDVALGGQGAPLVPIGDRHLFADYDYCLNIGGFANISYEQDDQRIAYDICPANYVLNHYSRSVGKEYDDGGQMAAMGTVSDELLRNLNELNFYHQQGPKSLGREWVEKEVIPTMEQYDISLNDKMRTFCEHVAQQIARHSLSKAGKNETTRMLITGGGIHNTFLRERIAANTDVEIVVPATEIINYKEALIFAFLGVLYVYNQTNCLSSVTGAIRNSIGGAMYR
jgi:anhydro-N-acetylmuramic acid kinase